jgi:hypothetical protein
MPGLRLYEGFPLHFPSATTEIIGRRQSAEPWTLVSWTMSRAPDMSSSGWATGLTSEFGPTSRDVATNPLMINKEVGGAARASRHPLVRTLAASTAPTRSTRPAPTPQRRHPPPLANPHRNLQTPELSTRRLTPPNNTRGAPTAPLVFVIRPNMSHARPVVRLSQNHLA